MTLCLELDKNPQSQNRTYAKLTRLDSEADVLKSIFGIPWVSEANIPEFNLDTSLQTLCIFWEWNASLLVDIFNDASRCWRVILEGVDFGIWDLHGDKVRYLGDHIETLDCNQPVDDCARLVHEFHHGAREG